jgi:hypothetical protein
MKNKEIPASEEYFEDIPQEGGNKDCHGGMKYQFRHIFSFIS